jgi:large subunit ribosomal protein L6
MALSRVARKPIELPKNVDVKLANQQISIKGPKGTLEYNIHDAVEVNFKDNVLSFTGKEKISNSNALAGTARANINNMITGVTEGYTIKLLLVGVGYRAQVKGDTLVLSLGFSHPVEFKIPKGITIESTVQTEVVIKGNDKQQVGQVAAVIRAYRAPEPYKGKGVRYEGEVIKLKETKKK